MAGSESKHQKLNNRKEDSVDDRISHLPTSLLVHILSFLPTKDAVATGILSKRWKFLWTNVVSLEFRYRYPANEKSMSFSNFVTRVLLQHTARNSRSIDKFSIESGYSELNSYDVESWVITAISRNVQELKLHGNNFCSFNLPLCVFTCKTLVVLKLDGNMIITVPSSVCIPNLKTLDLVRVTYQDDESLRKLVSASLVLENLTIVKGESDNLERVYISAPALKRLKIYFVPEFTDLLEAVLDINAPAVQYLEIIDYLSKKLFVANFENLIEADADLRIDSVDQVFDSTDYPSFVRFFEAVSNVEYLSLSRHTSMILNSKADLFSTRYLNLIKLTIGASCAWNPLLRYFLESADSLEVLVFHRDSDFSDYMSTEPEHVPRCLSTEPEHLPRCLSTRLRAISVENFNWKEDEVEMLKFFLKNGKMLRTLKIIPSRWGYNFVEVKEKYSMVQKILEFPRASETCEITFV